MLYVVSKKKGGEREGFLTRVTKEHNGFFFSPRAIICQSVKYTFLAPPSDQD